MEMLGRRPWALVWAVVMSGVAVPAFAGDIDPMSDYVPISGNPKKTIVVPTSSDSDSVVNLNTSGGGPEGDPNTSPLLGIQTTLKWAYPEHRRIQYDGSLFGAFVGGRSYQGVSLSGTAQALANRYFAFHATYLNSTDGGAGAFVGTASVATQLLRDTSPVQFIVGGGVAGGDAIPTVQHVCVSGQMLLSRSWHASKSARGIDILKADTWLTAEASRVFAPTLLGGTGDVYCAGISHSIFSPRSDPWVVQVGYTWSHKMLNTDDFSFCARIPLPSRTDKKGVFVDQAGSRPFFELAATTGNRFVVGVGRRL